MTREEAYAAIRNADKAGDTEAASQLAQYIQSLPDDDYPEDLFPEGPDGGMAVDVKGEIPKDDSALTGFMGGLIKPVDNAVRALQQIPGVEAANDAVSEFLSMPGGQEAVSANNQMRANNSRTGFQLAGNIAGTLPLAALPGGALAQGAAGGALLSDADTVGGVAADTLIGAAGGYAGDRLMRGAAQLAAPIIPDNLRTLIQAGIQVTPGQYGRATAGRGSSAIGALEDKLMSVPVTGDAIKNARVRGFEQFNRATVNRALEPIGASLPKGVDGRRAVAYAGDTLGEAYEAILPRLSARGDQQFVDDLAAIHLEAADMLPEKTKQFNNILSGLGRFWQNGSNLDGEALKAVETRIGKKVRDYAASLDPDQRELGDRLGDVLASVRDLAARQNPAEAEALTAINRGWKSLTQVERAAGNSRAQVTPEGYSQSVKQSSDTVRRRGYARGEALNQDLADAASDILPSGVPDSGTAGRLLSADMLNPITLMTVGVTAPTMSAARGATRALTRESYTSPAVAELLRRGAPLLGATGTATSIHALGN